MMTPEIIKAYEAQEAEGRLPGLAKQLLDAWRELVEQSKLRIVQAEDLTEGMTILVLGMWVQVERDAVVDADGMATVQCLVDPAFQFPYRLSGAVCVMDKAP